MRLLSNLFHQISFSKFVKYFLLKKKKHKKCHFHIIFCSLQQESKRADECWNNNNKEIYWRLQTHKYTHIVLKNKKVVSILNMHLAKKKNTSELSVYFFPLWDVKMLISFSPFLYVALSQNIHKTLLDKDWAGERGPDLHPHRQKDMFPL